MNEILILLIPKNIKYYKIEIYFENHTETILKKLEDTYLYLIEQYNWINSTLLEKYIFCREIILIDLIEKKINALQYSSSFIKEEKKEKFLLKEIENYILNQKRKNNDYSIETEKIFKKINQKLQKNFIL